MEHVILIVAILAVLVITILIITLVVWSNREKLRIENGKLVERALRDKAESCLLRGCRLYVNKKFINIGYILLSRNGIFVADIYRHSVFLKIKKENERNGKAVGDLIGVSEVVNFAVCTDIKPKDDEIKPQDVAEIIARGDNIFEITCLEKFKSVIEENAKEANYLLQVQREINSRYFENKKGRDGEKRVEYYLRRLFAGGRYFLMNDVILSGKFSKQIDHILINGYGIFVIETKNWSGQIYGSATAEEWTRYFYNGSSRTHYNPVKQNEKHCAAIRRIVGEVPPVYSVVIVLGANSVNVSADNVFSDFRQLNMFFRSLGNPCLTEKEAENYCNLIQKNIEKDNVSDLEHVAAIIRRNERVENGLCPLCAGKLVGKEGRYGRFYGCSNYPRCNYKKNIKDDVSS